jgi:hypothetical protein
MSFVNVATELVVAAASDAAGIGSAVRAANAAAALSTTTVAAAAADEVSEAIAALFGAHAREYQVANAQAAGFHERFVQTLTACADAYAGTGARAGGVGGGECSHRGVVRAGIDRERHQWRGGHRAARRCWWIVVG